MSREIRWCTDCGNPLNGRPSRLTDLCARKHTWKGKEEMLKGIRCDYCNTLIKGKDRKTVIHMGEEKVIHKDCGEEWDNLEEAIIGALDK